MIKTNDQFTFGCLRWEFILNFRNFALVHAIYFIPFFLDCTPESIFSSKAEHQVDLQRKLQEDPLLALRKKELDTRKRLLDNPIKMKQIQAYVRFIINRVCRCRRNMSSSQLFILFVYKTTLRSCRSN